MPLSNAQGYELQASTAADFTAIAASSVTMDITVSTLTVLSLQPGANVFLPVSAV